MKKRKGIARTCYNGSATDHKTQELSDTLGTIPQKWAALFVNIDDTILPKTPPSSKAKRPTQGTGWHYSHLEGKVVYGY